MTNDPNHCMHVAALRWAQAAFHDELDAEAVRRSEDFANYTEAERRGHLNRSIDFAYFAQQRRMEAREAEAAANGEPSHLNEKENDIEQILDGIDIDDHRKRLGGDYVDNIIRDKEVWRHLAKQARAPEAEVAAGQQ